MGLILQDDGGLVVGANAYLSLQSFKDYHALRNNDLGTATDPELEAAIIRATDYLDNRFHFVGSRLNGRSQSTEWPRRGARDRDGSTVRGIPPEVTEACAEYARRAVSAELNPDPLRDDTGALVLSKAEGVGPLSESVTYASGAKIELPRYPAADQKLIRSGLVRTGGMVYRG